MIGGELIPEPVLNFHSSLPSLASRHTYQSRCASVRERRAAGTLRDYSEWAERCAERKRLSRRAEYTMLGDRFQLLDIAAPDFVPSLKAILAADFSVSRGGTVKYSRSYRLVHEWKSAFMAVQAVPAAFNEYAALYPELINRAFSDPEFVKALSD